MCKMFYIFPLLLFFCACSPQKRLARLLKNKPELIKTDTVFIKDTIVIKGSYADTVFRLSTTYDTVTLIKNNIITKFFYNKDTVFLSTVVKDSLIIKEVPIQINKITPAKPKKQPGLIVLMLLAVILLLIIIYMKK